jgi:hypothetical protein
MATFAVVSPRSREGKGVDFKVGGRLLMRWVGWSSQQIVLLLFDRFTHTLGICESTEEASAVLYVTPPKRAYDGPKLKVIEKSQAINGQDQKNIKGNRMKYSVNDTHAPMT